MIISIHTQHRTHIIHNTLTYMTRSGTLHESTTDRLELKQIKKEYRSESKRRRVTTLHNTG